MARHPVPQSKAREILEHGEVRGHELTPKQKGLFGLLAGGGTPTRLKSPPEGVQTFTSATDLPERVSGGGEGGKSWPIGEGSITAKNLGEERDRFLGLKASNIEKRGKDWPVGNASQPGRTPKDVQSFKDDVV